ncbi:hypothetical protein [Bradyrhizobium diversitatis]|uniref:Uncharacterized protein n=1 Tax=Bradyrhizobium diversitatis TaxID=2755406 RepID=A0ABS0PFG1_9BRAD|nr:hypothetical protein [Bradyrhizobium diversitatis]MBH5392026.1 hypothetical protein [Bradyrhizobium diversitatis]
MLIRGFAFSAALFAFAPDAMAGEPQPGLFRRASCTVVRYYVAKYSAAAAETWARAHGATEAEIEAARRCVSNNAPAPAQTPGQAKTQTFTAGWAGH